MTHAYYKLSTKYPNECSLHKYPRNIPTFIHQRSSKLLAKICQSSSKLLAQICITAVPLGMFLLLSEFPESVNVFNKFHWPKIVYVFLVCAKSILCVDFHCWFSTYILQKHTQNQSTSTQKCKMKLWLFSIVNLCVTHGPPYILSFWRKTLKN